SDAQYNLGIIYLNGRGVPKDMSIAYMWFNICAAKDNNAEDARNILEENMTPEQIAEAQKMSREWVEKHKME
ncbi:MAG: sel1 repeat family protein, partial [Akkermansiaceae bacterium]